MHRKRMAIMVQELSKEELLNKIEKTAHDYERDYHGCSRCTLRALQEHLNLGDDSTLLASTPLAGGIAFQGDTCGALIGGLLAVGLATASPNMEDEDALIKTMSNGYFYLRRFIREIGSSRCRDIQTVMLGRSFNMLDPEESKRADEAGIHRECPKVVGKAARIAANFILEARERAEKGKS